MAEELFKNCSTAGPAPDLPDIFDVLEGGEDEGTVRFLLGFNEGVNEEPFLSQVEDFTVMEDMERYEDDGITFSVVSCDSPTTSVDSSFLNSAARDPPEEDEKVGTVNGARKSPNLPDIKSPVVVQQAQSSLNNSARKRDTSGAKAIHSCDSCGKCFTTKFNLKRHINMHCHKSKENGVPIQGPPSASAPAKKGDRQHRSQRQGSNSVIKLQSVKTVTVPTQSSSTTSTLTVTPPIGRGVAAVCVRSESQIKMASSIASTARNTVISLVSAAPTTISRVQPSSSKIVEYSSEPEPETETDKLPSVDTLLPVKSTTAATTNGVVTNFQTLTATVASDVQTTGNINSTNSSGGALSNSLSASSVSCNTNDYGTLPADLFDPDSPQSEASISPKYDSSWEMQDDDEASSPPRTILTAIPAGWTRRVCYEGGRLKNKFCSPLGKLFSNYEEIRQYFKTFNYAVPVGLFNFDFQYQLDDDEDEDGDDGEDDDDEEEEGNMVVGISKKSTENGMNGNEEMICRGLSFGKRRRSETDGLTTINGADTEATFKPVPRLNLPTASPVALQSQLPAVQRLGVATPNIPSPVLVRPVHVIPVHQSAAGSATKSAVCGSADSTQLATSIGGRVVAVSSSGPLPSIIQQPVNSLARSVNAGGEVLVFHTVPPCRQRIYQSQSYIRYIEDLRVGGKQATAECADSVTVATTSPSN